MVSGKYMVSPAQDTSESIVSDTDGTLVLRRQSEPLLLSNTTQPGKYEIYVQDAKQVLVFPVEEDGDTRQARIGDHISEWAKNEMPKQQLFEIKKEDDHYYIIWNDKYALTWDGNNMLWKEIDKSSAQWWEIQRQM